jgi:hypothetical protein
MMTAVGSGETFAALHGGLQIDYFMRRNPASAIYMAIDPDIRQSSDIRIAVRPDAPNLLQLGQPLLGRSRGHAGRCRDRPALSGLGVGTRVTATPARAALAALSIAAIGVLWLACASPTRSSRRLATA